MRYDDRTIAELADHLAGRADRLPVDVSHNNARLERMETRLAVLVFVAMGVVGLILAFLVARG